MDTRTCTALSVLQNRRGVAFPVALFAIIATGVLLTAVLVSGATEVGISGAHQDGTRQLYAAEAGIEAYVAAMGLSLAPVSNLRYLPPHADPKDEVFLTVRLLGSVPPDHPNAKPNWPPDLLYSVEARPVGSGRTVVATARVISTVLTLKNEVDAAVVSGSDVNIKGNTTVSDGTTSPFCDKDAAGHAIQVDGDNEVSTTNNVEVEGEIGKLEGDPYGYVYEMLGTTFQNLIANANIKFDKSGFSGNTTVTSFGKPNQPNVANRTNPQLTPFNWGCPKVLFAGTNTPCEADTDVDHFPIVAIDASNSDGSWGTVTLNLDHGQGMIVVYNGHLRIQGNLQYMGLILVEGGFTVMASGGGANAPKIEGSIIGLGRQGAESTVEEVDQEIGGSPTIRYNRCAIDLVVKIINETDSFDRATPRTSGWFEAVR